jgi:hypothetical protein
VGRFLGGHNVSGVRPVLSRGCHTAGHLGRITELFTDLFHVCGTLTEIGFALPDTGDGGSPADRGFPDWRAWVPRSGRSDSARLLAALTGELHGTPVAGMTVGQESGAGRGALWGWRPPLPGKCRSNRRWALGLIGLALLVAPKAAHQARSQTTAWTGAAGTTELGDRGDRDTSVSGQSTTAVFPSTSGTAIPLSSDVLNHSALQDFIFLPAATAHPSGGSNGVGERPALPGL